MENENTVATYIRGVLELVGEDVTRPGLLETPERVARSFDELLSGYEINPKDVLKTFPLEGHSEGGILVEANIPFFSLCEHHMLPFWGTIDVGIDYKEGQDVLGLSKVPRLIEVFTRRLQVQERLTDMIADALFEGIDPRGIIVRTRAQHLCMAMRGVCALGVVTSKQARRGSFKTDRDTLQEFNDLLRV